MVHLATQKFDIRKLVFSCLLAATAVLSGCGGSSESEFEQIVRQSNCVTADQVYADYQNNEVAAQQKYQGNVTRICGVVDEIELNLFNEPLISLRASLLGSVSIGGIDTASAANISKGSVAVFECNKINELLGIPVLMECRVVPTQNMQNEATSAEDRWLSPSSPNSDKDVGFRDVASNRTDYIKDVVDGRIAMPDSFYENLSCNELWYSRNYIYSKAGFCFQSSQSISTFGKGCFAPFGKLDSQQAAIVNDISGVEGSFCR